MLDVAHRSPATDKLAHLLRWHEVLEFNTAYGKALDELRLFDWVEMFAEDGSYINLSRENADSGLPVGLIDCENKNMIYDRAYALTHTAMFAPRYLRHMVSNIEVFDADASGDEFRATANYIVVQVLYDRPTPTIHQVGTYYDRFRTDGGHLKLAERRCVYDNLLVDNALCIPV